MVKIFVQGLQRSDSFSYDATQLEQELNEAIKNKGVVDTQGSVDPEIQAEPEAVVLPEEPIEVRPAKEARTTVNKNASSSGASPNANANTNANKDDLLRVSTAKVDLLLNFVGELVIYQSIMSRHKIEGTTGSDHALQTVSFMGKLVNEIQDVAAHHFPVVMLSSISYEEAVGAFRCFDLGAVDFIEKPKGAELAEDAERIRTVLKSAMGTKRRVIAPSTASRAEIHYKDSDDWQDLILIGASTGGPEAIQRILPLFPEETPPILIVQHIPAAFSKAFAHRLNEVTRLRCREARDGDRLEKSHVYVAPGGKQMRLVGSSKSLQIEITDDAPVNRHKPSVDYLFNSLCKGKKRTLNVSAALLTGMGDDGARGLKALRDWGCHTIAQDEASSVVYGMPKAAAELNAAEEVLSLLSIPHHLFRSLSKQRAA